MKKNILLFLPFIIILSIWLYYPFFITSTLMPNIFSDQNWQLRGVIGDSFGALNTLFSGLALAGLALNIYLQFAQLKKLEIKEEQNSQKIDAQAEALRLTALLHYYNNEIDRASEKYGKVAKGAYSEKKFDATVRLNEIIHARNKIVKKLQPEANTE